MAAVTVLGIGSTLMRDEGVGVRLMEAVRDARDWPDDVEFVDGGVGGLNLLNVIESAERLVVFDAAEMGLSPGEHRIFRPEDVSARRSDRRLSLHDMPFLETLQLCERFTRRPPIVIVAIQPKEVAHGQQLSGDLAAAFDRLRDAAVQLVADVQGQTQPPPASS